MTETAAGVPDTAPPAVPEGAARPVVAGRPSAVAGRALWVWLRVVGIGLASALALRACVFEAYRIPSSSMEETLLVGDLLFVSKLHYGAVVAGRRLPPLAPPRRGDVAVFHYPPGREPAVADRVPYIKRIVALPADTVAMVAKQAVVNGAPVPPPPHARFAWRVRTTTGAPPDADVLARVGVTGPVDRVGPDAWRVEATAAEAARLRRLDSVARVDAYLRARGDGSAAFPASRRYSLDDWGPVVVPRRGDTVALTDATWSVYRTTWERFEGRRVERTATGFTVDGRPAASVTFGQDYYVVLGDHRDDSADSRTWGFVPASHLIGKALLVYASWDAAARRVRWERIGRQVE